MEERKREAQRQDLGVSLDVLKFTNRFHEVQDCFLVYVTAVAS